MPHSCRQSVAEETSLAPHGSKARLISVTTRRRFMAKPCTLHLHCAARAVIQAANPQCRGQGAGPLAFSWDLKGAILLRERMAPFIRTPAGTQGRRCSTCGAAIMFRQIGDNSSSLPAIPQGTTLRRRSAYTTPRRRRRSPRGEEARRFAAPARGRPRYK